MNIFRGDILKVKPTRYHNNTMTFLNGIIRRVLDIALRAAIWLGVL